MIPERSNTEACTKISLPPRSGAMKPNPLSGTPRLLLRRGARIHTEDLRHLRPLRARAGTHLERRAGRHAAVATALNYAHMEECLARTVGQLDEAEGFV